MKKSVKLILLVLLISVTISACARPGEIDPIPEQPANQETPSPSPSSTLSPSPTPSPTPTPEVLVSQGEYALFVGDYETAYEIFLTSFEQSTDANTQAESQLGMGRAWYQQDEFGLALDRFQQAALSENSDIAARANYLLGQTYTALERYDEALAVYQNYLDLRPGILDSHVHELRASLFNTKGDYPSAITALDAAYRTEPSGGSEALAVKIAVAYQNAGQADTALPLYQNIAATTNNDYTKAEMDLRIGQILINRGETEQAYSYLQDAVNTVPYVYDAYTSLVILVEAGVPVNEYQRGLVNYNMGNNALAIEAFDRYLAAGAETNADAALHHKALATRALESADPTEQFNRAIALWEQLILDYPTSDYYVTAWEEIEFTLWAYLGEPQQAAEYALQYLAQRPESSDSADFLFRAGRNFERAGMLQEAADTWTRVANEYPSSQETFRSTYFAGIAHVRLGDWAGARALFDRALVLASETHQTAAAYLWIGKCQEAMGDISTALDSWKQAQLADPFGHYSIRAEDILIGRRFFSEPESFTLDPDLTPYRLEAEAWLRQTFNLAPDTNLESPGLLINDPHFQRGMAYWELGSYQAGKAEFETLRSELATDPAQTFRLIPTLVEIGLYRSALVASTELLKMAGLEGAAALEAPEFFSRVRFGAYYLDWLLPIAEDEDISPLLLLSVIRQESAYDGVISSVAGARGLMQIMPATAADLANELDWPEDYTIEDLNRPYVSMRFGAHYLRQRRNAFEGDLFGMLAGYNGGPLNASIWKELTASDDPDLFLEVIRAEETRNYIRLINEIHYIYRWLYGDALDQ